MPTYGCFEIENAKPIRTWRADYILPKSDQIQFWNRDTSGETEDVLVGVALIERGQTICNVESTQVDEAAPNFYKAVFADRESDEPAPYLPDQTNLPPDEGINPG